MLNQKGFTPILIVILIAVTLGGYLIYKQTVKSYPQAPSITGPVGILNPSPASSSLLSTTQVLPSDETADWKTYTDAENSFAFEYPGDFEVEKLKGQITVKSPITAQGGGYPDEKWFDLTILVKNNLDEDTANIYVDKLADHQAKEGIKRLGDPEKNSEGIKFYQDRATRIKRSFIAYRTGELNGIKGDIEGFEKPNITIIQSKNKKIYQLTLWGGPNTGTEVTKYAKELFSQILSTFKFTQ